MIHRINRTNNIIVTRFAANPAGPITTHVLGTTAEHATNIMTVRKANNAQPKDAVSPVKRFPVKRQEQPAGILGLKIKVR
ncbi:MAG: hypothetical protein D3916_15520 [Candidatus Electrothrix sp. MAN1_4]|nr:hypothetical protein [Candidatus Electrothrix sp. MAN1_4]